MTCSSCGTANASGSRYCENCGRSLSQAVAVQRSAQAVPTGAVPAQWAYAAPHRTPDGQPIIYTRGADENNGMAIAAMVCGILWLYWLGSILAVVFGHIALSQINRSHGTQKGKGFAIAGLVLGYVGVGTLAFVIISVYALSSSVGPYY